MGRAKRPRRVKLIIGMLAKDIKLFDFIEEFFVKRFGQIDYRSRLLPFNHTDYYKEEMGHPLQKKFIAFKKLISPEDISKIKVLTNHLENKNRDRHRLRRINIDPGYVSDSKLVLATTKDYFHRVYLKDGIYAEVTLFWRKHGFESFAWTYPDYKTSEYTEILNDIRKVYMDGR